MCRNVLPTDIAEGYMSTFQAKYDTFPVVDMFHIFGCIVYIHVSKQLRDSMFVDKAYEGFFVRVEVAAARLLPGVRSGS